MQFLNRCAIAALAMCTAVSAQAADFLFSFQDGGTQDFYGRTHIPGTVSGILFGLADSGTSLPTSIKITSADAGIGLSGNTFTVDYSDGSGFEVNGGQIVAADLLFNFTDLASNAFQLRFNYVSGGSPLNLNLLFWNGGNTPVVGTGNQGGFAGVTYAIASGAVPESATWAMMIAGFGLVGAAMRRRASLTLSPAA